VDELRKFGATSNIVRFVLRHNITGQGLTGLSSASSGLIIGTIADMEATTVTYTVAAGNVETITTLGTYAAPTTNKCRFKEVDATNHPGLYEFQFVDTRFSVGSARALRITVKGLSTLLDAHWRIMLAQFDPFDAVRMGQTALPNVAAGGDGSVMTQGATQAIALKSLTIVNSAGDAVALTSSGANGNGLNIAGNGSGTGLMTTGGATGHGIRSFGGATSGHALVLMAQAGNGLGAMVTGNGVGAGLEITAGASGVGLDINGGATSGHGMRIMTTSGDGLRIQAAGSAHAIDLITTAGDGLHSAPVGGHGISAVGNGTSKHGLLVTGGTGGTSDGLSVVAGTGGVPIRGDITGTVSGLDAEVAAILALLDDARGEPGQGAPPVNPDLATKIDWLYKAFRNKKTQTATLFQLFADDTTTVDTKSTVSDDGTTTTVAELVTGP
jgi:hypothetical protein